MSEYYQNARNSQRIQSDEDPDQGLTEPVVEAPAAPVEQPDPKIPGFAQMFLFLLLFLMVSGFVSAVFAVAYVVLSMITGADLAESGGGQTLVLLWSTAAGNCLGALVCLLVGKSWSGRSWSEILPFRRFNLRLLPALVVVGAGLSIMLSEVDNLLQYVMPMPQFLLEMMADMVTSGFLSFILLVVVAPWTEELIFRGFVLNGFLKRYKPRNAVILSALGFSILHLNPYQLIGTFVIGVVLGWVRLKTGSLWPCIFLHAVFNGFVFCVLMLPVEIPGYNLSGVQSFQPWWLNAGGVGLVVTGCFLAWRMMRGKPQTSEVQVRW